MGTVISSIILVASNLSIEIDFPFPLAMSLQKRIGMGTVWTIWYGPYLWLIPIAISAVDVMLHKLCLVVPDIESACLRSQWLSLSRPRTNRPISMIVERGSPDIPIYTVVRISLWDTVKRLNIFACWVDWK